jgi:hypothetical protein
MSEIKKVVVKQPSKKELIAKIQLATGKNFKELESLARTNKETLEWILELTS